VRRVIAFFVDRPLVVNLIIVATCIFGVITAMGISRTLTPPFEIKKISISATLPGASAVDMERFVTFRLEEVLQALPGLKKITSITTNGNTRVTLQFKGSHDDMSGSLERVKGNVETIKHRLPRDLLPLDIRQAEVDRIPGPGLHVLNLDPGNDEHRRVVESIAERMRRLAHVVGVDSTLRGRNLHIAFDARKLADASLDVVQARARVLEFLRYTPVGQVRKGDDQLAIQVDKGFNSIEDLKRLPLVVNRAGRGIRLDQVAKVELRFDEELERHLLGGKDFVELRIWQSGDGDSITVSERVREVLDAEFSNLPDDLVAVVGDSPAELIEHELGILKSNGIGGILIVLLILLIFLGPRISLMTALGLPFCYLGCLLVLDATDVTFNLISLFSLILVLGILVDDAIIVSEAFAERLLRGMTRRDAAIDAAHSMMRPVLGMMITTALAFAPLLILKGDLSQIMRPLPIIVIGALVLSLIESFFLLPNHLCEYGPRPETVKERSFVTHGRRIYRRLLGWVLTLRYPAIAAFLVAFVGAGWIVQNKMEFNGNINLGTGVRVHVELKDSDSLDATHAALEEVEAFIAKMDPTLVKRYETTIGYSYIGNNTVRGLRYAAIQIIPPGGMAEWDEKYDEIIAALDPFVDGLAPEDDPTSRFKSLYVVKKGSETDTRDVVSIYVSGSDRIDFDEIQAGIREAISGVEGVKDIYMDDDRFQPSWAFVVDHAAVLSYDLTTHAVAAQLRQRVPGPELERVRLRGEELLIFTGFDQELDTDRRALMNLRVMTPRGITIPMRNLGEWKKSDVLRRIEHEDMLRIFKVDVVFDPETLGEESVEDRVELALGPMQEQYPGYTISVRPNEGERENKIWLIKLAVIVFGLIYLCLALTLNSLIEPLLVVAAIPFGLVGVIFALYAHGMDLEIMAVIGVLGLTGVVVNDSLVVVDTIRRVREEDGGASSTKALIMDGAGRRFQAVVLTSLTTLGGVFPLAYGLAGKAGWIQPMVFALGWGLIFATLLTLFLLPSMLLIVDDSKRLGRWVRRLGKRGPAAVAAVLLVGCTPTEEPEPTPPVFDYPLDDVLRVNHIQAVGTHNSYHVQPASDVVPDWSYTHAPLDEQLTIGVRQFELDVHRNDIGFEVMHVSVVDDGTTCATLEYCLQDLKGWSDGHPAHHPLLVMIEPKDNFEADRAAAFFALLEAEILAVWSRDRIITPDDLRGAAATIEEALADTGWPTLGASRGKIIFQLLDRADHQDWYTNGRTSLDGRLLFANASADDPFAGVILMDDPEGNEDAIAEVVGRGILVRTRADAGPGDRDPDDRARRDAALASGAHAMSTDFPRAVESGGYEFVIPGGEPSRCNPVTAPPECTAAAIEDPAFIAD
jgi:multidrug efflux pump subunit AcrB